MKKIIISGHGNFADGMYSSIKIILGEKDFVYILNCYVDPKQDVAEEIKSLVESFENEDEILCFTDVFGGSVNNEFMKYINRPNFHLITGSNLNVIIDAIININNEAKLIIDSSINEGRRGVTYCNELEDGMEEDSF